MKYDLTQARKCIETLDKRRFDRALLALVMHSDTSSLWCRCCCILIIQLCRVMWKMPQQALPILSFPIISKIFSQKNILSLSKTCKVRSILMLFFTDLRYLCDGQFGSISQTSASDLDIWVCHQDELSEQDQQTFGRKKRRKLANGHPHIMWKCIFI